MEVYPVSEACKYTNMSASALVAGGKVKLLGIFVASSSAATIKLWDNTAGSGTVMVNTFTAVAGTFYPIPGVTDTGLFVTITGTADITVFWSRP